MSKYKFVEVVPTTSTTAPHIRSGHRCVTDGINLYVFGGYNPPDQLFTDLWSFNLSLKRWQKLETSGPRPLFVASCSLLLKQGKLIVFGGSGYPFGSYNSNETFVCHLKKKQWQKLTSTGDIPAPCYGHSAVLNPVDNNMYIFGGTSGSYYFSTTYKLNLETLSWHYVVCNESPSPRYRHECIRIDGGLLVLGGYGTDGACNLTMVYKLCYKDNRWYEVICLRDEDHGYPGARRAHSCVKYDNYAYICGGYEETSANARVYDDLWRLDLNTFSWHKIDQVLPWPRFFHAATVTNEGCMYIFGGIEETSTYTRTNQVFKIWLVIPSLFELCWEKISENHENLMEIKTFGIPKYFQNRLEYV